MQIKTGDVFIARVAGLRERIIVLSVSYNRVEYQADAASLRYNSSMPLSRFILLLKEYGYVKQ